MLSPPLTPEQRETIRKLFPPEHISKVSALLLAYGERGHEREVDRVRSGILTLSSSDITQLERMVAMAKTDYRDLIVAAEYTRPGKIPDHG